MLEGFENLYWEWESSYCSRSARTALTNLYKAYREAVLRYVKFCI